jgi:hypothetical protein
VRALGQLPDVCGPAQAVTVIIRKPITIAVQPRQPGIPAISPDARTLSCLMSSISAGVRASTAVIEKAPGEGGHRPAA